MARATQLVASFGLRYEYNTPPREGRKRIEGTFNSTDLAIVPGLRRFIDGRTRIYEPDRNNFAPRAGLAYSPALFGVNQATVIRVGYGLCYDQILGAVVSQSRNVFPTFLTVNFAGGGFGRDFDLLTIFNPYTYFQATPTDLAPGSLNRLNGRQSTRQLVDAINFFANRNAPNESALGATLPARQLPTPFAHHYSLSLEQQLSANLLLSVAYAGTTGRNLLRFTTPNLGPNEFALPLGIDASEFQPEIYGFALPPGTRLTANGFPGGRPVSGVGFVSIFETTATSRYDALQVQLRAQGHRWQYQLAYTFSKALDDVSDVFDLAGAAALPQHSCTPNEPNCTYDSERGLANFDARHRLAYGFTYALPSFRERSRAYRFWLGGYEVAGTGQFQTGQPFTINSSYDVNLDGNLTDRLNSTSSIVSTGERARPFRLNGDPAAALASPGNDGRVGRNTFRGGSYLLLNLALNKNFAITERQQVSLRAEAFNFLNRANFALPVRFLEAHGFGASAETVTPGRRIQFALKYSF